MSITQPIRDTTQLKMLKEYYYVTKPNLRNYALICLGLNSALRISDLLELKWGDVYDVEKKEFLGHIVIIEKKTGKENRIALNKNAVSGLYEYQQTLDKIELKSFLFPGQKKDAPLSRVQAFRIIKKAAKSLHLEKGISCHSMRKTFGYHAWQMGVPPAVLMDIYNHSSYQITKRYLGISQQDRDNVFLEINL